MNDYLCGMAAKISKRVGVAELAKHLDVNRQAIYAAIRAGNRFTLGKSLFTDEKTGKTVFDLDLAKKEWYDTRNPEYAHSHNRPRKRGRPSKDESEDPEDLITEELEEKMKELNSSEDPESVKDMSLNEAKRLRAVYQAKTAKIEYEEYLGSLVDKQEVYNVLYAHGQKVHNELMALPNKICSEFIGITSTHEFVKKLKYHISEALKRLSEPVEL